MDDELHPDLEGRLSPQDAPKVDVGHPGRTLEAELELEVSGHRALEAELVVPAGLPEVLPALETELGSPAGLEKVLPH